MILDEKGVVQKAYDYYPFGMQLRTYQPGDPATFTFTGKQLDQDGGLDWYYFGARFYDPEVGRFLGVDPLAEKYPALNPYQYTKNNPLKYVDRDGMQTKGDEEDEDWRNEEWRKKNNVQIEGALKAAMDVAKIANEIGGEITKNTAAFADATSDASTAVAIGGVITTGIGAGLTVAGVPAGPPILAAGLEVTKDALSIGLTSDMTSLVAKGTDVAIFNGSKTELNKQFVKTGINVGTSLMFQLKPLAAVARTSRSVNGPLFQSTTSGRFVSNTFGSTVSAARDATKVAIGIGF